MQHEFRSHCSCHVGYQCGTYSRPDSHRCSCPVQEIRTRNTCADFRPMAAGKSSRKREWTRASWFLIQEPVPYGAAARRTLVRLGPKPATKIPSSSFLRIPQTRKRRRGGVIVAVGLKTVQSVLFCRGWVLKRDGLYRKMQRFVVGLARRTFPKTLKTATWGGS